MSPFGQMELNIASTSQPKANPRVRLPQLDKVRKGSWKKRRREEVLQRAKGQKRLRPPLGARQASKALLQQADEFSSGIDAGAKAKIERPGKGVEGQHGTSGKRSVYSAMPRSSPATAAAGDKKSLGFTETKPRGQSAKAEVSTAKTSIVDKADQRPEAVSATLAIIADGCVPTVNAAERASAERELVDGSQPKEEAEKNTSVENDAFASISFTDTGLYRSVAVHMEKRMGLQAPTKIQEKVLKVMLNLEPGQQAIDVLVRSATGSGKTLAYLLPIAHYLLNRARRITREDGALAVIVVPTRELADQVEEVAGQVFRPWHWIVVGSIRGGESKKREKARLRKGINVLVATPGRLLDHMRNTRSFTYHCCEFLVLDEADRLLDLGFEDDIKEAIDNLGNQSRTANRTVETFRSNMLLSATLRNDVQKLAEFSLHNPVEISVNKNEEMSKASFSMPMQLRQHFCIVEQRHRLVTLACFLRLRALKGESQRREGHRSAGNLPCKVIVFFSTCDSVDFHYELLRKAHIPKELKRDFSASSAVEKLLPLSVFRIHGNHSQADRVQSLRGFRRSNRAVLFCTDVAARGLDLKGLTFAIQYDPPTGGQGEELEYFHRAGRTARIGTQGDALLFLLPSERAYVGKLESKGVSISEISGSAALAALYPRVDLSKQESISYGTRLVTSALQEAFEGLARGDNELMALAVAGFQAYCRAYSTHAKEVRYFFHVRNLHLGHVARAFLLGDKPAELNKMILEMRQAKSVDEKDNAGKQHQTKRKADIARAIAEGEHQPFNDQSTSLARRRREKGRGLEAMKELAFEFGT